MDNDSAVQTRPHRRFVNIRDLEPGMVVSRNSEPATVTRRQQSPDRMHWRISYEGRERYDVYPNGARFTLLGGA